MPSNVGCVLQPTFLPWAGFFDLMDQCDVVVWLDDVGFSKQSWQQRNRLRGPDGLEYLSVPVKTAGKLGQNIYSVEVADDSFSDSALRRISELYESSSHYSEFFPKLVVAFEEGSRTKLLAELNVRLIDFFCVAFDISKKTVRSSQIPNDGKRGDKVAQICESLGIDTYISPWGAANYLAEDLICFLDRRIDVYLHAYEHPVYTQAFEPFLSHASVVDLLMNEGDKSFDILRSGRREPVEFIQWRQSDHDFD